MEPVYISICIPAYKRANFLPRLLESIAAQEFRDFEVVLTDNSGDDDLAVANVVASYASKLPIRYIRNERVLSMGENWNRCMAAGTGTWLKMMHDDDWFASDQALGTFAAAAQSTDAAIVFSSYNLVSENTGLSTVTAPTPSALRAVEQNCFYLAYRNVIGPPSTTLIRSNALKPFKALKWMVDVDGYISILLNQDKKVHWIPEPLIAIQAHSGQATQAYFRNPAVEIPENLTLLGDHYPQMLRYYWAYDHFWRLFRNLGIRNREELQQLAGGLNVPPELKAMLRFQTLFPKYLLNAGPVSKALMTISFFLHRPRKT